jgi:hypothetical protein
MAVSSTAVHAVVNTFSVRQDGRFDRSPGHQQRLRPLRPHLHLWLQPVQGTQVTETHSGASFTVAHVAVNTFLDQLAKKLERSHGHLRRRQRMPLHIHPQRQLRRALLPDLRKGSQSL